MINQEIICQLKYGIASSVSKKVCTCICVQYFMSLSVFQFVVEDSVEERMMALQDQKRKLMQGAFGQKQTADDKRTNRIRDIKTLMDLWDVARRIGEERLIPGPYCRMIDRGGMWHNSQLWIKFCVAYYHFYKQVVFKCFDSSFEFTST